MEAPCAAAGDGVSDGDSEYEVVGVLVWEVVTRDVVCGAVECADGGVELPVACGDAYFVSFFKGRVFVEFCDGGGGIKVCEVVCEGEAWVVSGHVVGRGGESVCEVFCGGEWVCADVVFVCEGGEDGYFVSLVDDGF